MSRFVGKLDFAPQDPADPTAWRLEQNFGFLRDDGLLIIAILEGGTDGASIPRFLWRVLGHPFSRCNRFWAIPHDAGYRGYALVIDTRKTYLSPEALVADPSLAPQSAIVQDDTLPRKWWDDTLLQAMTASGEPRIKRFAVYRAVRWFGTRSYRS